MKPPKTQSLFWLEGCASPPGGRKTAEWYARGRPSTLPSSVHAASSFGRCATRPEPPPPSALSAPSAPSKPCCSPPLASLLRAQLYGQAQALLSEHKGRKKMGEEPVLEMLEAMCNEGDKGGEWLNGIDVVGTKGELQLQTKDGFQDCSSDECKAVVRVCDSVKTEAGGSDLAEMIYRGHYMTDADAFAQRICTKMTESCGEAPVVLKDARIDEPFAAMDSKKWEAKKMQKMMSRLQPLTDVRVSHINVAKKACAGNRAQRGREMRNQAISSLTDLDRIIYVDCEKAYMLDDVARLWAQFKHFSKEQSIGASLKAKV